MKIEDSFITDSEIIKLVLSGDREQYAELVRRHHGRVIAVCRGILSDPTQAEDAAQDTFIKAFQLLAKFEGRSSFSTWIYRIATNHCLDIRRKTVRQKTDSWDGLLEQGYEQNHERVPQLNAEKLIEMKDFAERLLADLSESERSALVLRESQGLSYEEIGEVLGISLDAVKSRLKRARHHIEEKARHYLRLENV